MRVVIADDTALLREGLARMLAERGFEVAGQAGDAGGCRARRAAAPGRRDPRHPHAADAHRRGPRRGARDPRRFPDDGVLVLSQYVETALRATPDRRRPTALGYLLKDASVASRTSEHPPVAVGACGIDRAVAQDSSTADAASSRSPSSPNANARSSS